MMLYYGFDKLHMSAFWFLKTMAGYFISLFIFWESLMRKAALAK